MNKVNGLVTADKSLILPLLKAVSDFFINAFTSFIVTTRRHRGKSPQSLTSYPVSSWKVWVISHYILLGNYTTYLFLSSVPLSVVFDIILNLLFRFYIFLDSCPRQYFRDQAGTHSQLSCSYLIPVTNPSWFYSSRIFMYI